MNILCIDCPYSRQLEALGHKVFAPDFPPGVIYLPGVLQINNFMPDLVIQHERLSARVIMGGLEKMPCPTIFVSVDSHLNMFWHKYYGRLFDLVLTPHVSLFGALSKDERLPHVRRIGPAGYQRPFRLFSQRPRDISFSGVLTEHRPARTAMVQMLAESVGLYTPDKMLPHGEMLDLFMQSRMIPNESIAREVNFRLFEGASCGALVFSQNIGEDQNAHFEPGFEFETYEHALELVDKIKFYRDNPDAAEAIGRAAWERVRAEHLPEHRAAQIVAAANTSRRRADGDDAAIYFWLTLAQMARNGTHPLPVKWFLAHQFAMRSSSLVDAMKLRLLMEGSHQGNPSYSHEHAARYKGEAARMLRDMLKAGTHSDSLDFNLAGAMAALALGRKGWARAFWLRQEEAAKKIGTEHVFVVSSRLESPYDHYIAWGKRLMAARRDANVGFNFRVGMGFLPGSAFECFVMAQREAQPEQTSWLAEMHRVCSRVPGFAYWDMGMLAEISLNNPDSWRDQLEYGVASLANYRIDAGMFEIFEARAKAEKSGETESYNTMLEAMPASGYILSALLKG